MDALWRKACVNMLMLANSSKIYLQLILQLDIRLACQVSPTRLNNILVVTAVGTLIQSGIYLLWQSFLPPILEGIRR
jgi:hypothetical protein